MKLALLMRMANCDVGWKTNGVHDAQRHMRTVTVPDVARNQPSS